MDFDTIMEKAYEEYFEGLAEGEEALSFSEFKQAGNSFPLSLWERAGVRGNNTTGLTAMAYTTFSQTKNDQLKEPMFFGQPVNVARYDQQKY
ncbi:hypothetical protein, partial [Enterobacter hormaechei]|uniref:hypothetical protein n=1 Tax=Enterobacter hormaechei TaxID=158836 RepID=UPI0031FF0056